MRGFKTDVKGLLEDPIGLAKQFEQFLGPNIYTWEELDSILRSLFSSKERQMTRLAGMQIWERENQQGPPGENEMPIAPSQWNPNDKRGRREMNDYRNLITKGIREAAPKVAISGEHSKGSREKMRHLPNGWDNSTAT